MTNDMNIYKTDITFEDDRVIHFMYDQAKLFGDSSTPFGRSE